MHTDNCIRQKFRQGVFRNLLNIIIKWLFSEVSSDAVYFQKLRRK